MAECLWPQDLLDAATLAKSWYKDPNVENSSRIVTLKSMETLHHALLKAWESETREANM